MKENPLASRTDVHIVPDSSRVVALLFVAGGMMAGRYTAHVSVPLIWSEASAADE